MLFLSTLYSIGQQFLKYARKIQNINNKIKWVVVVSLFFVNILYYFVSFVEQIDILFAKMILKNFFSSVFIFLFG